MNDLQDPNDKPRVSNGRLAIWIIVGGIGAYLVISGLIGALTSGG